MTQLWLSVLLLSDAHFGRGDGVVGTTNQEVQHDEYGLPFLVGKTLKGLLNGVCAEVMNALGQCALAEGEWAQWQTAAQRIFGSPGSRDEDTGLLRVGRAQLPVRLRAAIAQQFATCPNEVERASLRRDMLAGLTGLRAQTAMDATTGAPKANTLRTMRVIMRDTRFEAELTFGDELTDYDQALLGACVKGLCYAGTLKNRGLGKLIAQLYDRAPEDGVTETQWFDTFRVLVGVMPQQAAAVTVVVQP